MIKFIMHRIIGMITTMLAVSIIVFTIMQLPPGDYAERYAFKKFNGSDAALSASDIENIRIQLGLDKPLTEQYFDWIKGIVTEFDFGDSFTTGTSVNEAIGARFWLTLLVLCISMFITYAISIPVGIYAAMHRHSLPDYVLTVFSYMGLALPNFLLALVMLYFSVKYFGSTVGGLYSPEYQNAAWSIAKFFDLVKHLIIPAVVLAWSAVALQLQTVRATMQDEINKLSVTAARARGIPEWEVMLKYPARLAMNPIVGSIGFDVNRMFSDIPIVATVLGLSDMGGLLLQSYIDCDMFVAGAILLILTFIIVFLNFVSDILLAIFDPRIKLVN